MKSRYTLLPALLLLCVSLTGCKQETSSYQIDASRSFTLQRIKNTFWSRDWERWLTVARMPDCQRKHRLDDESEFGEIKLRQIDDNLFQLQDGKTLYEIDLQQCTLTELDRKAEKQGETVGKFTSPDGKGIAFEAVAPKPQAAPQ